MLYHGSSTLTMEKSSSNLSFLIYLSGHLILPWAMDDGCQGIDRTSELARHRYYSPRMDWVIRDWCKSCIRCILAKNIQPHACAAMDQLLTAEPNCVSATDELAQDWQELYMVTTDDFSKFTLTVIIQDKCASIWLRYL